MTGLIGLDCHGNVRTRSEHCNIHSELKLKYAFPCHFELLQGFSSVEQVQVPIMMSNYDKECTIRRKSISSIRIVE